MKGELALTIHINNQKKSRIKIYVDDSGYVKTHVTALLRMLNEIKNSTNNKISFEFERFLA